MSVLPLVTEAVRHVQARSPLRPSVGLVLGSGLGAFAQRPPGRHSAPLRDIPHFPTSTAIGHNGELVLGTSGGVPVAVMAGRVHHYEGYSLQQVVFPVRVLGPPGREGADRHQRRGQREHQRSSRAT